MLPYLLHLLLLAEILLSKSQTVKLFTPNTSFSSTLEYISKQVCFFVFVFFFKICWCGSLEFVKTLLLLYGLVFWPQGMWDLSFPTRDRTHTPCIRKWSLNHWTSRKVPPSSSEALFFIRFSDSLEWGGDDHPYFREADKAENVPWGQMAGSGAQTYGQLRAPISATRNGLSRWAVLF